jgi:hypothetical protein
MTSESAISASEHSALSSKNLALSSKNLGLDPDTIKGGIYLLPSESIGTIVQYYPFLRISCALPKTTRNLSVFYKSENGKSSKQKALITTPKLLLSQVIYNTREYCGDTRPCNCRVCFPSPHPLVCFCHSCLKYGDRTALAFRPKSSYYLHAISDDQDRILGREYRLANVYEDSGKICIGNLSPANNLRQMNFNLWNSTFNDDFGQYTIFHRQCSKKTHYFSTKHFHKKHNELLRRCRKNIQHKCGCLGESGLHEYNCHCYRDCSCKCVCDCCAGKCQCACDCCCCKDICSCRCGCDLTLDYIELLKKYNPFKLLSKKDLTEDICGSKYLSSSAKTGGIFISHNDELKDKIDSKYHCRTKKTSSIIGFANYFDNEWRIDLNDQTLVLAGQEVYVL